MKDKFKMKFQLKKPIKMKNGKYGFSNIDFIDENMALSAFVDASERKYIHPDSVHLLNPCQWDLIEEGGINYGIITDSDKKKASIQYCTNENGKTLAGCIPINDLKIIQRNGIHFMMPECEGKP